MSGRDGDHDAGRYERPTAAGGQGRRSSRAWRSSPASPVVGITGQGQVRVEPHPPRSPTDPRLRPWPRDATDRSRWFAAQGPGSARRALQRLRRPHQVSVASPSMSRPPSVDAFGAVADSVGTSAPTARRRGTSSPSPMVRSKDAARRPHAEALRRTLLTPVVNATGVLLHTNLGHTPAVVRAERRATRRSSSTLRPARGGRGRGVGPFCSTLRRRVGDRREQQRRGGAAVLAALPPAVRFRQPGRERRDRRRLRSPRCVDSQCPPRRCRNDEPHEVGETTDARSPVPGADVALVLKVHPQQLPVRRGS